MADIRRADSSHWREVRSIRLAAMKDAPYAFGSTYEREVSLTDDEWVTRLNSAAWFLAWSGNEPIGIAAGVRPQSSPAKERHLMSMWVQPEQRGTGLASELVNAVRTWAAEEGAVMLTLCIAEGNSRARRFYEKLGFSSTGKREIEDSNPKIWEQFSDLLDSTAPNVSRGTNGILIQAQGQPS